jgi:outer membrane protein assembly factor BamE (lipoprotein component of BamABCDE complex)
MTARQNAHHWSKRMKTVAFLLAALATAVSGCTSYSGRGLVPGQSTTKDVEAVMGPPAERITVAAGDSVWFYPRNPFGLHTYAVRISPQGVVREIDQRLTVANLAKLVPGATTAKEVREILGPPWRVTRMDRQQRDAWQYRMDNGYQIEHNLFVQFSSDGVVREVLLLRDPKYDQGAPSGRD